MTDPKLNPRQKRFVEEYLVDLNATKAAERAGYSKKTAYSQGQRLLKNVEIKSLVQEARENLSKRVNITTDSVLFEMAYSGYSNMQNYIRKDELGNEELIPVSELTPEEAAAIIEWSRDADGKMKIKLADKHRPLVDIGRHLGMFPSNVQVTGKDGKDLIPRLDINDRVALGRALAFTLAEAAHHMTDENTEPKQE